MTVLSIGMSPKMARMVSKATDILNLPSNQDFALKAMGLLLRSMGLAPTTGRPMGYRHSARAKNAAPPKRRKIRRRR